MQLAHRLFLMAVVCAAIGVPLGIASWVAQGPLPGDAAVTRGLQTLFGADPGWASALTATAKPPWVWATVTVGMALAYLKSGWRGAFAVPAVFLLARLMDLGLREAIYVPKPDADLVPIASPSDSSGLPSTFGLVFGTVFGAAAWFPRVSISRWPTAPRGLSAAATVAAIVLLVAGLCCRVVLGGHWFSQMTASLLTAFALTLLAGWVIWAWRQPAETLMNDVAATPAEPAPPVATPAN